MAQHRSGQDAGEGRGACSPPDLEGGLGPRMGICPCSLCGVPKGKEEEVSALEKYRRDIQAELAHVERRLGELMKK